MLLLHPHPMIQMNLKGQRRVWMNQCASSLQDCLRSQMLTLAYSAYKLFAATAAPRPSESLFLALFSRDAFANAASFSISSCDFLAVLI
jgi:hypothetical protein